MRGRKHSRNAREYMLLRNGSIFIFICIFILIGTGYALLNTQIEIQGKATLNVIDPTHPVEPSLSVATLEIVSDWGGGSIIKILITNNDEDLEEWNLSFEVPTQLTDVLVHNGSAISDAITNFDGNKVTIKMNKTHEDGSTNWAASWAKGENKYIQVQFTFSEEVENFSISNLIFNNKLITLDTGSTTSLTEDTVNLNNSINNKSMQDNVIENQNTVVENAIVENIVEQNQTIESSVESVENVENVAT